MAQNTDSQTDTAAMLAEYAEFQLFRQFRAQTQVHTPFTNLTNATPSNGSATPSHPEARSTVTLTNPVQPALSQPALSHAQPPPVDGIQPYRPININAGHPAASHTVSTTPVSLSITPFRDGGFRDLISQADADRLATADRYRSAQPEPLPRQLTRASRSQNSNGTNRPRRGRGQAVHPPGLPRRGHPDPRDSVFSDPQTGEERCRLQVNVHLRDEGGSNRVLFHTTRANQAEAFRTKMHLDPQFQLPLNTTVLSIMELVYESLTTCQYHYSLPPTSHDLLGRPEPPFLLLEFTNSGRRNANANNAYLRTRRPNHDMTVNELLLERNIAIPQWALREGSFQVHFLLDVDDVEAVFSLEQARLGTETMTRRHHCLSERFHLPWYFGTDTRVPVPDTESGICECADEAEEEETMEVQETLVGNGGPNSTSTDLNARDTNTAPDEIPTRPSSPVPVTLRSLSRQAAMILPSTSVSVPVSRSRDPPSENAGSSVSAPVSRSRLNPPSGTGNAGPTPDLQSRVYPLIPSTLFPSDFTLLSGVETVYDITDLETFLDEAMLSASPSLINAPRLRIDGASAVEAAHNYLELVKECVRNNDFEVLLSRNRHFEVGSISFGEGVEAEIISMAWRTFTQNFSYFFRMSAGNKCSISTSVPLHMSALIPPTRLEDMAILGAMTALMMVYGKYPEPLSPAILQFFIYGAEPRALDAGFVSEWLPELFHELKRFENTEPNGDLSSFNELLTTYTNFERPSIPSSRTPAFHNALAAHILYQATVGFEPPQHDELQAFLKGYQLRCSNGFDFPKMLKTRFCGGSLAFLSVLSLSHISGYDSIKDHVKIGSNLASLTSPISEALGRSFSFTAFVNDFLKGSGIPCDDAHWTNATHHFHPMVQDALANVDKPFFRAQMFFWAATGCPEIRANLQDSAVQVLLVSDNDVGYMGTIASLTSEEEARTRRVFLNNSKISFRTCAAVVRIPASYAVKLIHHCQEEGTSPGLRLEQWFLVEVLSAIGQHSMV